MLRILNYITAFTFLFFSQVDMAFSQTETTKDSLRKDAINIYMDCSACDMDFIRKEITFVNYVREPKKAQVHILVTSQTSGNGGMEYTLFFIGQLNFKGKNDTLKYNTMQDYTNDIIRKGITNTIKIGLIQYVARSPLAKDISIKFDTSSNPEAVKDKWKNWVFNIEASGWGDGEESRNRISIWSGIYVSKVTEKIKVNIDLSNSYSEYKFKINTSDSTTSTVRSINRSQHGNFLFVKSISEHWSAGFNVGAWSSTFSNINVNPYIYPSIEYDLFKYSESNRRQLRFLYSIGYDYYEYFDTTIFGKIRENLGGQRLRVAFQVKEKWGSISSSVTYSSLLNDLSKNSLSLWADMRIRIFKGLSFTFYNTVSLIHNQIALPKGEATQAEVLLQQRQLATQYSYYLSLGITYTFGSIYNNVVNPRFND
ncbi:MAG: hypothetical protein PHD97_04525 [Bacteroidales bacterium]|nr:hypothetical protein [Bacteroidales bacterium]